MTVLEPIWQNLPPFFKSEVVKKLGYKDRCSLRKCSHSDLFLVDSTPNILDSFAINTFENYSFLSWSNTSNSTVFSIKYYKNLGESDARIEFYGSPRVYLPGKNQKIIFKKTKILDDLDPDQDDLDLVLADFQVLLKKLSAQKSIINGLIVKDYHPIAHPDRTMEFRERLLILMTSPIKSTSLTLHWHQEDAPLILKNFKPKYLQNLEFSDRNSTWKMSEIVQMDQWKSAKKVYLEVLTDLKTEDFEHFEEVQMHVRNMEEKDLWKVIQNFISKNHHGSSFHFTYRQAEPDLQRILDTFDAPPRDEPIRAQTRLRSVLGGRFIHTQRFPMPNPDLILVVMISEKEVMGTVCHRNMVDVEAKVERGLLR